MPVPAPELHWPTELVETGPKEDPSILLGENNLDQSIDADHELEVVLDEVAYFGRISRSSIVELEGDRNIIWMVPSGSSAAS